MAFSVLGVSAKGLVGKRGGFQQWPKEGQVGKGEGVDNGLKKACG